MPEFRIARRDVTPAQPRWLVASDRPPEAETVEQASEAAQDEAWASGRWQSLWQRDDEHSDWRRVADFSPHDR